MSYKCRLIEALEQATAEDLLAIRVERSRLQGQLDSLRAAEKILERRLGIDEAVTGETKADGAVDTCTDDERRDKIFACLSEAGRAMTAKEIQASTGISYTAVGKLTKHEWFSKTGRWIAIAK